MRGGARVRRARITVLVAWMSLAWLAAAVPPGTAAVSDQAAPAAPAATGVYTEDFATYTAKDYTENAEWDIWARALRLGPIDGTSQTAPAIARDGNGNAVVVWEDDRNGNADIYAQKLDWSGNRLWEADVRVNSDSGTANQRSPGVALDGSGNTIVVWEDSRNGNPDIYAQKLDGSGNKPWAADVRVNSDSGTAEQESSAVAVDRSGSAVVVWHDYRNISNDVYAQKLDGSGSKLWGPDLHVGSVGGVRPNIGGSAAVAVDGSGNAVVVWWSNRNGNADIYAQKLDGTGNRLWGADVRVNSDGGAMFQGSPAVAVDGSGNAVVVWQDDRNGGSDIYAQKLDGSGNKPWAADVRVNSDDGTVQQPAVAVDGSRKAVVVWQDYRSGNSDIYAQELDGSGNKLWAADERINSDSGTTYQGGSAVAVDGSGNAVVVWRDDRNGNSDIYAQKLDGSGDKLWAVDKRINSDGGTADQDYLTVAVDGSGNPIVVWQDDRNSNNDIYAQRLDGSGNKLWGPDVRVNSDGGTAGQYDPTVAVDGSGKAVIVWQDYRNGNPDIYAQEVDGSGTRVWATDVHVSSDNWTAGQQVAAVAADGNGGVIVVWMDGRNNGYDDIYAQWLNGDGNRQWPVDLRVNSDTGAAEQWCPDVAMDGSGNAIVVWQDYRNGNPDIYAQRVTQVGGKGWSADLQVVYPDLFHFPAGTAQSRTVDAMTGDIRTATLTAEYQTNGGSVQFYLTNDGGAHWAQVMPGVTHVFTTSGSDLRWKATLTGDAIWRQRTPLVTGLRIEYSTQATGGDDYESDDTCTAAKPIAVNGAPQQHSFHQPADADWAWFQAQAGTRYVIQTGNTGPNADTVLELYNACGQPPTQSDDNAFAPGSVILFQPPASGSYYLKVSQHDPAAYGTGTDYQLSLRAQSSPGVAVIVAGRLRLNDSVQPAINATANLAYRTFLESGLTKDRIYYLNADLSQDADGNGLADDVDGLPTKANVRDAIQSWARARVGLGVPLWLYLMDHGEVDRFYNDVGEQIQADELNLWLSNLEAATGCDQITVIIEACFSGSFIDTYQVGQYGLYQVSGPNRVVVTSTSSRWWAYGPSGPSPTYFSSGFFRALGRQGGNQSVWDSFLAGQAEVYAAGQVCADYSCQKPWLDDTGDQLSDARDGLLARSRGLAGSLGGSIIPTIDWVQAGEVDASGRATVRAQVRDDGSVTRVWVRVFAPSFVPPTSPDGSIPVIQVPERELAAVGSDVYQVEYDGFTERGAYQVVVYAVDDEGNSALPRWVWVGQQVYLPLVLR